MTTPVFDSHAALLCAARVLAQKDDIIKMLARDLEIAEARIRILELRQQAALRTDFDLSADAIPIFHRRQAE